LPLAPLPFNPDLQECENCNKPDHILFHTDEKTTSAICEKQDRCDGASQTVASDRSDASKTNTGVRLVEAPVRVFNKDRSRFFDTYGFLDNGSQVNNLQSKTGGQVAC